MNTKIEHCKYLISTFLINVTENTLYGGFIQGTLIGGTRTSTSHIESNSDTAKSLDPENNVRYNRDSLQP